MPWQRPAKGTAARVRGALKDGGVHATPSIGASTKCGNKGAGRRATSHPRPHSQATAPFDAAARNEKKSTRTRRGSSVHPRVTRHRPCRPPPHPSASAQKAASRTRGPARPHTRAHTPKQRYHSMLPHEMKKKSARTRRRSSVHPRVMGMMPSPTLPAHAPARTSNGGRVRARSAAAHVAPSMRCQGGRFSRRGGNFGGGRPRPASRRAWAGPAAWLPSRARSAAVARNRACTRRPLLQRRVWPPRRGPAWVQRRPHHRRSDESGVVLTWTHRSYWYPGIGYPDTSRRAPSTKRRHTASTMPLQRMSANGLAVERLPGGWQRVSGLGRWGGAARCHTARACGWPDRGVTQLRCGWAWSGLGCGMPDSWRSINSRRDNKFTSQGLLSWRPCIRHGTGAPSWAWRKAEQATTREPHQTIQIRVVVRLPVLV